MNEQEHLYCVLGEEYVELAKAALEGAHLASKAQRHGADNHPVAPWGGEADTNAQLIKDARRDLWYELHDVAGVMELLGFRCCELDRALIDAKKKRLAQWMQYSRERGTLEPEQ